MRMCCCHPRWEIINKTKKMKKPLKLLKWHSRRFPTAQFPNRDAVWRAESSEGIWHDESSEKPSETKPTRITDCRETETSAQMKTENRRHVPPKCQYKSAIMEEVCSGELNSAVNGAHTTQIIHTNTHSCLNKRITAQSHRPSVLSVCNVTKANSAVPLCNEK